MLILYSLADHGLKLFKYLFGHTLTGELDFGSENYQNILFNGICIFF